MALAAPLFRKEAKGFIHFLWRKENEPKETSTYPKSFPIWKDLIDYEGNPLRQSFGKIYKAFALRVNLVCLSAGALRT